MRATLIAVTVCLLVMVGCNRGTSSAASGPPETEDQKTLYALGASMGQNLSTFSLTEAELEYVKQGLADQVNKKTLKVELQTYRPKIQELARNRGTARADVEKKKGTAFLEEAAKEPGAVKAETGFVFRSLTEGSGSAPALTDTVKVHYRGTLTDGTEFDSSIKRGEPATFPLRGVIPCWTQGVQKMKVGGKAKLTCPSELAYADRGSPPLIPGGATLVFEVELLGIEGQGGGATAGGATPAPDAGKK